MDINYLNSKMSKAIENEDDILILELVKQGADTNFIGNNLGYSVLESICYLTESIEVIDFVIKKGADIYGENNKNYTGLHFATMSASIEMIEYFLDLGIDVNSKSDDGYLPIDEIWYSDRFISDIIRALKLLIDNGSTIYEENGDLLEWVVHVTNAGFDIKEYYKNSNFDGNVKPAKR
jgi:ankyrin repeat protein